MRVGVLPLRRWLTGRLGGAVLAATVGALALVVPLAAGNPPAASAPRGGIFPVPGMGPPGAVAAVGALRAHSTPKPAVPLPMPAPLVAAKFLTPPGVRVTAFPGSKLSKMYDAPVVMGLRPGYVYRFELMNLPYHPGKALYPEVEVRGSIVPRPGMKYMDYPIPLVFSQVDIERALLGTLVTKVIYLEDPEKAVPTDVLPDAPVESPDDTENAALRAARENGRLMAIVRLGDRRPSAEELQTVAIDGTILLPGEKYLKAPALPPVIPFFACPLYDPILGPKGPKEECIVNGDDKQDPLGIGPNGRLGGLNPTDVGVEYTSDGKRRVTTSCLECICAPRYMVRRVDLLPGGIDSRIRPSENLTQWNTLIVRERVAPMADVGREKANEYVGRTRPSSYIGRVGTAFWVGTSAPSVIGQVFGVKVEGAVVEPEQLTAYPICCPLTVTKVMDPPGPKQAGDIVTLTIRYVNTGAKPVSDLVVSDSLSGRLEYVEGSAASDRAANFTTSENEAGSLILRWELPGTLLPGQGGTIKFRAKVR